MANSTPLVFAQNVSTSPNLKIAVIGDSGLGNDARAVLRLIKSEGAEIVFHAGDFAYDEGSRAVAEWETLVNEELGADFPYVGAVGNHDDQDWNTPNGYRQRLEARVSRIPSVQCRGPHGIKTACTYKGLFFLLSGVGTLDSGHEDFLRSELSASQAVWRICMWHKNQRNMQVGGKGNEVGWGAYEECRRLGAVILTGHEHSYERTKTLSNMQGLTVDSQFPSPTSLTVGPGRTFAVVSGLGGNSIRPQLRCLPGAYPYGSGADCNGIWASILSATQNPNVAGGALFLQFNTGGNPRKATGYFKTTDGNVVDNFEVSSLVGSQSSDSSSSGTTSQQPPTTSTCTPLKFSRESLLSYGGATQDRNVQFAVNSSGSAFALYGDGWKAFRLPLSISPNTILQFNFWAPIEGDIQAIGLDTDLNVSDSTQFQLLGTQSDGRQETNIYDSSMRLVRYRIPVGRLLSGQTINYLTFRNQHQASPPRALSLYHNVCVYEATSSREVRRVRKIRTRHGRLARIAENLRLGRRRY